MKAMDPRPDSSPDSRRLSHVLRALRALRNVEPFPPDADLADALKAFVRLIDILADVLRAKGEKPHMMASALRQVLARCRAAMASGDPQELADAEAEADRLARAMAERTRAALKRLVETQNPPVRQ